MPCLWFKVGPVTLMLVLMWSYPSSAVWVRTARFRFHWSILSASSALYLALGPLTTLGIIGIMCEQTLSGPLKKMCELLCEKVVDGNA